MYEEPKTVKSTVAEDETFLRNWWYKIQRYATVKQPFNLKKARAEYRRMVA